MKNDLIKIPLIVLAVAIVASILWTYIPESKDQAPAPTNNATVAAQNPASGTTDAQASVCYYSSTKTPQGDYDKASLIINTDGTNVTGQFSNLPAEKDASEGTFAGTVDTTDPTSKLATVSWDENAEGAQSKNELLFVYNDATASVGFGEMVSDGNGGYVYKDKTKIVYSAPMKKIDCDSLNEITAVENYINDNIQSITTGTATPATPAGTPSTWAVTSINVDPSTHAANIGYTDGQDAAHSGTADYMYDTSAGTITITNFTQDK